MLPVAESTVNLLSVPVPISKFPAPVTLNGSEPAVLPPVANPTSAVIVELAVVHLSLSKSYENLIKLFESSCVVNKLKPPASFELGTVPERVIAPATVPLSSFAFKSRVVSEATTFPTSKCTWSPWTSKLPEIVTLPSSSITKALFLVAVPKTIRSSVVVAFVLWPITTKPDCFPVLLPFTSQLSPIIIEFLVFETELSVPITNVFSLLI